MSRKFNNQELIKKISIKSPETVSERSFRFVASDDSVDTSYDIVNQSGWDLENFKKNPVILWSHKAEDLPIGRATSIGVENNRLMVTIEFAEASGNPLAENVFQLVKAGFLNAVSVGFQAIDFTETNDPERGGNTFMPGVDFHRQSLAEISLVTVPANPNALILSGQQEDSAIVVEDKSAKLNKDIIDIERERRLKIARSYSLS